MGAAIEADALVQSVVCEALARSPALAAYAEQVRSQAAIHLHDVIDHIAVGYGEADLAHAGWVLKSPRLWRHDHGFPMVVERPYRGVAFRVERLDRAAQIMGFEAAIDGPPGSPLRKLHVPAGDHFSIALLERNGGLGEADSVCGASVRRVRRAHIHQQIFRTRRRHFRTALNGFHFTGRLIDAAVADLGEAWAAHLFLRAERDYWIAQSEAGMRQKVRQDRTGVGWCSVDHMTYCASREHFRQVVALFGKLGFAAAGTVSLERPNGRSAAAILRHFSALHPALLLEVDTTADEDLTNDAPLSPITWHGHAGLWCALHGEPLLEGGPARLAARYDLPALEALERADGRPFQQGGAGPEGLRQQICHDEPRPVSPARVEVLERGGYLSRRTAEEIRVHGALSTHLLAIERSPGSTRFTLPNCVAAGALDPLSGPSARRQPMRMRRRKR